MEFVLWYRSTLQGRIQKFILGGAKPRSPIESYGQSPNRGAKRPSIEGEARVEARSARELRAKPEPRAKPEKNRGEGSGGGGSVSPSPENFWKIKLETNHFGAYLKQLFEMTN